jgi:hypothetical protein
MKPDYYVVTFETKASVQSWHWEIRRRSNPMGVRLTEGGYQTQMAAENAGKRELAKFFGSGRERRKTTAISWRTR